MVNNKFRQASNPGIQGLRTVSLLICCHKSSNDGTTIAQPLRGLEPLAGMAGNSEHPPHIDPAHARAGKVPAGAGCGQVQSGEGRSSSRTREGGSWSQQCVPRCYPLFFQSNTPPAYAWTQTRKIAAVGPRAIDNQVAYGKVSKKKNTHLPQVILLAPFIACNENSFSMNSWQKLMGDRIGL